MMAGKETIIEHFTTETDILVCYSFILEIEAFPCKNESQKAYSQRLKALC